MLAWGDERPLNRPCVNCCLRTGRFCDGWPVRDSCKAALRIPTEEWADGQLTPLCSRCDDLREFCHFCKKVAWATPPEWPLEKQGDREKSKPPEEQGLSEQGKRNEKSKPPEERGLHEQGERKRQEGEAEVVEGHEDHTGEFEEWVKCEEAEVVAERTEVNAEEPADEDESDTTLP